MAGRAVRTMAVLGGLLAVSGCSRPSAPEFSRPSDPTSKLSTTAATAGSTLAKTGATVARRSPEAAVAIEVSPGRATLGPGDLGLQLLVRDAGATGGGRDLTAASRWEAVPQGIVAVSAGGYVRPLQPGTVEVRARFEGRTGTARVTVAAAAERPWDFAEEVVPVLTRSGCNTGGCHGRADGQNGFHLSLFGYDPAGDYHALTRDAGGRRVSRLAPSESLVLLKALGRVPHGGGPRFAPGSVADRTLRAWIEVGAPFMQGESHGPLVDLRVEPAAVRLDEPGPQQLRVVAEYRDGHRRDVTRLASYRVNDPTAADVDPNGRARVLRRAETDLIVRYRSRVVSTRLATVINPGLKFDFARAPRRNFIDEALLKRLEALKVPPSPPASDAAFLRRVSLDLTGQQPLPERIKEFLADTDPEKRVKLVDRLLQNPDFVLFWELKLGDLLQITSARFGNGATTYQTWLGERLAANAPWDAMVRELLTALGDPTVRGGGPANYALDGPDAKVVAEQTAQRFLGLRLRCAQCHDHPFDVWTQDDYFGLAACFAKVQGGGPQPGRMGRPIVKVNPEGKVEHLRTKQPAMPRLLDGTPVVVGPKDDPRVPLVRWLTAPENPYFARAMANWTWAQLFGKGLADPADDLSRANPPVHPELLDALGRYFVEHHFDLRALVRVIATSEAYGLSSAPVPGNEIDTRLFSHQLPRPLTAHQMADALAQATDVPNLFPNYRYKGKRAIEIMDPTVSSTILDTFGRCPRTNGCAAVVAPTLSLRQMLLVVGGDVVEKKVSHLNGYLANLLDLEPTPEEIVENLYLRTVCRPPTEAERDHWAGELRRSGSVREAAEDLFWALLNSREFAFNH